MVADITNSTQAKQLVNKTASAFGRLDVLVNDAGLYSSEGIDSDKFFPDLEAYLALGVHAALELIKESVSALSKTNGTIINISSFLTAVPVL